MTRLGYRSKTLVFVVYHITRDFDYDLSDLIKNPAVGWWLPNVLFLWALLRFDVFHFFFDGGLWSGMKIVPEAKWLELPLLRLAGKRIVASAYGADVRTRQANELWQPYTICMECPAPGKSCICDHPAGMTNAKYYRDWCNAILAMGDMHDFVFDSRQDFVYWPIDVKRVPYAGVAEHDGPVRIAHSPNHRHFKGTRFIEEALRSLRDKGLSVELDLVEGISNEEARRRYAEADILVPQCLAGWIGYTEIEGMAAGKPVVSYLRNPDYLAHTPGCPIVSANPDTLESALEKLIRNVNLRQELGRRGREYVERYWSHEALAPSYDSLHQDIWRRGTLGVTMREKWKDFFEGESRYRVGGPLHGPLLEEWIVHSDPFLNLRRISQGVYGQPPFDEHGIPRMSYNGTYVEHPGVVALYALNLFHCWLVSRHDQSLRLRFLTVAEWLAGHLVIDRHGTGRWYYPFQPLGRKLSAPWVSCFSQSLGLSILLRAEQIGPGAGYLEAAHRAVELFRTPVTSEGILWEERGDVFLEEYPENPPAHVLNGFITGLFGLQEYYRVTGTDWARELFNACLGTLRSRLECYETSRGLRYDMQSEGVVSPDYYYFQIQQLLALHRITQDTCFLKRAQIWKRRLYTIKALSFLAGRQPL